MFCENCGKEISNSSKFCKYCGTAVNNEEKTSRKQVYEGDIHKCPSCGEVLESFALNCPACGYEIRNSKNSNAIEKLAFKLEEIENERKNENIANKVLGALNLGDGLTSIDKKKISLIRSFPIPNNKEDLYEFLILSKSNIDIDCYDQTKGNNPSRVAVSDAWKAKFEQAYQKAKLLFKNDDRINEIDEMYNDIKIKISKEKRKYWIILGGAVGILIGIPVIILIITALTGGFNS